MKNDSLDISKIKVHPRFNAEQAGYWLKIREAILAEGGKHYNQSLYSPSACGTACCLMGHGALILFGRPFAEVNDDLYGHLGITLREATDVADGDGYCWKAPFDEQFANAVTQHECAQVAGDYILSILTTGEV